GLPERDRVEDLDRVRDEVATGDQRQGLAPGRIRPGPDDERPPDRVEAAQQEGCQQTVGEKAGAAADAGEAALATAALRALRLVRTGDDDPRGVGDVGAHLTASFAARRVLLFGRRSPAVAMRWDRKKLSRPMMMM